MHPVDLANDREENLVLKQSHQQLIAEIRNMDPDNWRLPPVPHASYVKVKATGEILAWTDGFASRPDLVDPCDADGNIITNVAPQAPEPVRFNTDISRKPVGDEHTSPVGMASQMLGVAENFSQDYTEPTTIKEALPLPKQETAVAVDELVKAVFKDNI